MKAVHFFSIFLGLVLSNFLCGCKKESPSESKELSNGTVSKESQHLVILTWKEYLSDKVISDFQKETGIAVNVETFENLEEFADRVKSTPEAFDLLLVDDVSLVELAELKLIQKLQKEKLVGTSNLSRHYTNQEFDPGNQYSVPYNWGTSLIAYRTDKIESPKRSWSLLWDPKLKGRVVMLDSELDLYSVSLMCLGYPVHSEDEEQLQECTRKLVTQARDIRAQYCDLSVAEQKLQTGEAWAGILYSGDAATMADENPNIGYFLPEEGANLWLDSFAIARDAKNVSEAHEFLNFLLRPEVAAETANFLWGGSPNEAADEFLDPDLLADIAINPPEEILEKCDFTASPSARRNEIMNQGMKQIFDIARDIPNPAEPDASPPSKVSTSGPEN